MKYNEDATNQERGMRALRALRTQHDWRGLTVDDGDDVRSAIGDLCADLRHLCDSLGLDYAACDAMGHAHYIDELAMERGR